MAKKEAQNFKTKLKSYRRESAFVLFLKGDMSGLKCDVRSFSADCSVTLAVINDNSEKMIDLWQFVGSGTCCTTTK